MLYGGFGSAGNAKSRLARLRIDFIVSRTPPVGEINAFS
jgi:hypothetical protein